MADTLETIALRLRDFIQKVERNAGGRMPTMIRGAPRTSRPKEPILETYEACLNVLTPEERGEFDRMVLKMSGAFGSPPGAITPP
jgi:hypothetical protein